MDFLLSTLVWILGPIVLGAALVYAVMRRKTRRTVKLPPDHPAKDHTTEVTTNRQEPSR
ncbi:MAG: hypothetical protein Q8M31_04440 [Beijerinckiaceae bacterium]|nr:hypothetical protein [Beijerinckiaceae bacterium]